VPSHARSPLLAKTSVYSFVRTKRHSSDSLRGGFATMQASTLILRRAGRANSGRVRRGSLARAESEHLLSARLPEPGASRPFVLYLAQDRERGGGTASKRARLRCPDAALST